MKNKVQLITYPNSLGRSLKELRNVLEGPLSGLFDGGVHILPPFPSSGDRGFAPLTYLEIDPAFGEWSDLESIGRSHDILVDLMVNHISRQSEQFQDYLKKGPDSAYADLFITLSKVWSDGVPVQSDIDRIFLRRTLPYSEYQRKGHGPVRVWTTFGKTDPSEQIDVDIHSDIAKKMFEDVLRNFSESGVKTVRLDAVGYVNKKAGTSCFFLEPEIYEFLDWISALAEKYHLTLLPEVHADYHFQYALASRGYWIYDFILPYRIVEAIMLVRFDSLARYLTERPANQVTMLDCHDGLPIMPDLNGLVDPDAAQKIVDICLSRGCNVSKVYSNSHKSANGFDVHQIRGTIYSVLNENDDDYIIARAIQLFTPGVPQVYYVGLLAGTNQYQCAAQSGDGREINRYNYSVDEVNAALERDVVKRLIRLIRFRNGHPSFQGTFAVESVSESELTLIWTNSAEMSSLHINLLTKTALVSYSKGEKTERLVL
ncbi:MAG: sucrose phosphorylase [Eubacteriales bacterium]|nr:sucrose phosphorylase [Eubacteriales bacterium]